jgi:4-hydroxy-2-oxoheptanedioate aldolase
MGLIGQLSHSDVQAAIIDGIKTVTAAGKAAGVLTGDQAFASQCFQAGASFVGVGVDTSVLVRAASALVQTFKQASV